MKRAFLIIFLSVFASGLSLGQEIGDYPIIPQKGKPETLIPDDYSILEAVKGDLNQDGLEDQAIVIESKEKINEDRDGYIESGNARILLIFHQNKDSTYQLIVQENELVMRSYEGGIFGDPYESINISDGGVFSLSFYGGSSWRWSYVYKFRFQNDDYYLIGQENMSYWNGDGRSESWSYNFLTGKMKYQKGNVFKEGKDEVPVWHTLVDPGPHRLSDIFVFPEWEVKD